MMQHQLWALFTKPNKTLSDEMLLHAIVILSLTHYRERSYDQIFDMLRDCSGPLKFDDARASFKEQLNRIEEMIMSTGASVQRLQADDTAMLKTLTDLQAALSAMLQSQSDAEARLEADIASLRSQGGNGDPAALDAIATSLESTQAAFAGVTAQLTAAAQAQIAVDPAPAPTPTPAPTPAPVPATLTISPPTVSVSRTAQVQFSTNGTGATFSAVSGTVDATGLYTPPTDPSIMSDSVTATFADGKQTAPASVLIT